ncbi:hypothetical protein D9M68_968000 [compost metagenome]
MRWLIEPLSVISPRSMDGGSASTMARAMRVALPVEVLASSVMTYWKCSFTYGSSSTSAMGALAGRPLSLRTCWVGKIIAPTSFKFRPVSTTSCT